MFSLNQPKPVFFKLNKVIQCICFTIYQQTFALYFLLQFNLLVVNLFILLLNKSPEY